MNNDTDSTPSPEDDRDLEVAIAGVQWTLEHTNEDETRTRMKSVLTALKRIDERHKKED